MTQEVIPYSTDGTMDLIAISDAQRSVLTQQTPDDAILTRKGKGGKTFSYVPHAWVTETLNNAFGWAWSWEITEWRLVPEAEPREVFVLGRLTVHGRHGDLAKTQFGSSDVKRNRSGEVLSIGDDLKAASSDALKKCASLLGIALDLYKADVRPSDADRESGGTVSNDPMSAYWEAARAKGLTQAEGQANLQQHGGDPNKALKALIESNGNQLPDEKPEPGGNGTDFPNTGEKLLAFVNERVQVPYDNAYNLRGGIRKESGNDEWDWPAPTDREAWREAYKMAFGYAQKKEKQPA